jgi:hypothetical protein
VPLGGQVVDLLGPHLLDDADEAGGVREVAVVQDEFAPGLVGVLIEVVDAISVLSRLVRRLMPWTS